MRRTDDSLRTRHDQSVVSQNSRKMRLALSQKDSVRLIVPFVSLSGLLAPTWATSPSSPGDRGAQSLQGRVIALAGIALCAVYVAQMKGGAAGESHRDLASCLDELQRSCLTELHASTRALSEGRLTTKVTKSGRSRWVTMPRQEKHNAVLAEVHGIVDTFGETQREFRHLVEQVAYQAQNTFTASTALASSGTGCRAGRDPDS